MRTSLVFSAILASALFHTGIASAHAIWLAERHGTHAIVYGHGSTDEAYDPSKLKSVGARKADGTNLVVTPDIKADHVLLPLPEDAVVVTGFFDNGFWSKDANGKWINEPKSKVSGATEAGHYVKYLTAIVKPLGKAAEPQGMALEIVPLVDPLSLHAGQNLPLLILANGKPLAGAEIVAEYTTASEQPTIKSGTDGKATIKDRKSVV